MANFIESGRFDSRVFRINDIVTHTVEGIRTVKGKVVKTSESGLISVNVESVKFPFVGYKNITVDDYYWRNKPVDIFCATDPRLRKIDQKVQFLATISV